MLSTKLLIAAALARCGLAAYVNKADFSGSSFFDHFDFYTGTDPTNGFVKYEDQSTASSAGLISTDGSAVYVGVDSTNVVSSGRPSVRMSSKDSWQYGLFIADVKHMPGGICGTWPALWLLGANAEWPNGGEIDIIEGVSEQTTNAATLHTTDNCAISNDGSFSGSVSTSNCYVQASGQSTNSGCSITDQDSTSYGTGFNANNGGVYATEWTTSYIAVYFFPRSSIPSDITSGSPNPSSWGTPFAHFSGCDIPSHFGAQQLIIDTTFCGDWAGQVWSSGSCASKADSCQNYVANNPSAFKDAYWSFNSIKVYQDSGARNHTLAQNHAQHVAERQHLRAHLRQHRRSGGRF